MAGAVVQAAWGTAQTSGTSCTVAFPVSPTVGNIIVCIGNINNPNTFSSITDTLGLTYTQIFADTGTDGTNSGFNQYAWYAQVSSVGSNTITLHTTASGSELTAMFVEISGVLAASSLDGSAITFLTSIPGTGANGINSTAASNTNKAFVLGFCGLPANTTNTITAGTSPISFTSTTSGNVTASSTTYYAGVGPATIEWASGVLSGSHQATFTDATHGGSNFYYAAILMFDEDTNTVSDPLTAATNTDLVLNNQNWNYTQESATNDILCGTKGAFCNAQVGANFVNALYTGSFSADQQAQCTLASFVTGAQAGVGVRYTAGAAGPNCYVAYFDNAHWNLGLLNNGSFTTLSGGQQPRTNNVGDVVILQVRGNTITLTAGGTTLKTVTDNTWTQGQPGLAFTGVHPSTIVQNFRAQSLGIQAPAYTVSTVIGQVGGQVVEALTNQTIASSSSSSGMTVSLTRTFAAGPTATFVEGQLINVLQISGQSASFTEGSITTSITGGASLILGPITAGFVPGQLFDNISYVLDQGALTVNLFSQTATFVEGTITETVGPQLTAETVTTTEGTVTDSLTLATATAQTITSTEGVLTANLGNNVTVQLLAQTVASSEGSISETVSYAMSAETGTFVEGTITFSNSGSFAVQLGAQILASTEGTIVLNIPVGTGPPLFIPPTLGKPVTTRTFSWGEMAQRAWGSEFRAPDHRIYQFSGGNYKDSTDLGTTGIYTNQQGPADNP